MALLVKQGVITSRNSAGTQVVSVGFQPKVIIFHAVGLSGTYPWSAEADISYGFVTSTTQQTVTQSHVYSGGSAMNITNDTHCIYLGGTLNTFKRAKVSAISTTGFTLNWTQVGFAPTAMDVMYTAIGGDDVIAAKTFNAGQKTSSGSYAVTGLGFEPNTILVSTGGNRDTQGMMFNLGVATPSAQWTLSAASNAASNSGADSMLLTNQVVNFQLAPSSVYGRASLSSFDADGFTLNFTSGMVSDSQMNVLALRLAQPAAAGTILQKTTTGTSSYTGLGGNPKGMMFMHRTQLPSTGYLSPATVNSGFTDGTANYSSAMGRGIGAYGWARQNRSEPIMIAQGGGTTSNPPTSYGEATVSFDFQGFSTNWINTDGTAREIAYLAFVESSGGETHEGSAAFSGESDLTTAVLRTRHTSAQADGTATVSLGASALREATAALDGSSDLVAIAHADRDASASLSGTLSTQTTASVGYETALDLSGELSITTLGGKLLVTSTTYSGTSDVTYQWSRLRRPVMRADINGNLHVNRFFELRRIRAGALSAEGVSDTTVYVESVTGGMVAFDGHLMTDVTTNAMFATWSTFEGESDFFVEFTPDQPDAPIIVTLSGRADLALLAARARHTNARFDGSLTATTTTAMIADSGSLMDGASTLEARIHRVRDNSLILNGMLTSVVTGIRGRTSNAALTGVADLSLLSYRGRQGRTNLSGQLDSDLTTNAALTGRGNYSGQSNVTLRQYRGRFGEVAFDGILALESSLDRVRQAGLVLASDLDLGVDISLLASTGATYEGMSDLTLITNALWIVDTAMDGTSDLTVRATPILLVTYEDAYGTTRQQAFVQVHEHGTTVVGRIPQGDLAPTYQGKVRGIPQGRKDNS